MIAIGNDSELMLTLFTKGVFALETTAKTVKGLTSLADHHAGRVGRTAHHLHDEWR